MPPSFAVMFDGQHVRFQAVEMLNFVSLHDNRCLKCPSAICFGEGRDEQMLNVSHEIFRTFMMKLSLFF